MGFQLVCWNLELNHQTYNRTVSIVNYTMHNNYIHSWSSYHPQGGRPSIAEVVFKADNHLHCKCLQWLISDESQAWRNKNKPGQTTPTNRRASAWTQDILLWYRHAPPDLFKTRMEYRPPADSGQRKSGDDIRKHIFGHTLLISTF